MILVKLKLVKFMRNKWALQIFTCAQKDIETRLVNNIKNYSKSFFSYVNSKKICTKVVPLKDRLDNFISDEIEMVDVIK